VRIDDAAYSAAKIDAASAGAGAEKGAGLDVKDGAGHSDAVGVNQSTNPDLIAHQNLHILLPRRCNTHPGIIGDGLDDGQTEMDGRGRPFPSLLN
jgi:hypothetical protein